MSRKKKRLTMEESSKRVVKNAPAKRTKKKRKRAEDLAGAFNNGRHVVSIKFLNCLLHDPFHMLYLCTHLCIFSLISTVPLSLSFQHKHLALILSLNLSKSALLIVGFCLFELKIYMCVCVYICESRERLRCDLE